MAPVIIGNADRPELAAELTNSFCRTDPDIAKEFARVTFNSDNRADLTKITIPTLILQCSIGCGGGLLSEPAGPARRQGLSAPDASATNIEVAKFRRGRAKPGLDDRLPGDDRRGSCCRRRAF